MQVYSWGFGDLGALGHQAPKGEDMKDEPVPRPIDFSHVLRSANSMTVLKVCGLRHSVCRSMGAGGEEGEGRKKSAAVWWWRHDSVGSHFFLCSTTTTTTTTQQHNRRTPARSTV